MEVITVYVKGSFCHYCALADKLLKDRGISYEKIVVDRDITRQEFYDMFREGENRTYPQIVINGVRVGGFQDLEMYFHKKDNA